MQHQKARQKYEQEQNNIQGNTLYIQLLCKTILITNKYFSSMATKKTKSPSRTTRKVTVPVTITVRVTPKAKARKTSSRRK